MFSGVQGVDLSGSGLRTGGLTGSTGLTGLGRGFSCSGAFVVVVVIMVVVVASVFNTTGFSCLTGVRRGLVGVEDTLGPVATSPPAVGVRRLRGMLLYDAMNPSEVTLRSDTNCTNNTLLLVTMFL